MRLALLAILVYPLLGAEEKPKVSPDSQIAILKAQVQVADAQAAFVASQQALNRAVAAAQTECGKGFSLTQAPDKSLTCEPEQKTPNAESH